MSNRINTASWGWLVVFGSVAIMGTTMALAQRAVDPGQPPARATAQPQPGDRPANRAASPTDPLRSQEPAADTAETERRRPRDLGIKFDGADELIVGEVAPGSVAADAGLRPRDRIISVDGRPLVGQRRFAAFLSGLTGRRVPIVIEREGKQYTVQLTAAQAAGDGPWLGVFLQDNQENELGARVTHVYPAGPAARAGLRPGDVILKVNDQDVQSTPDLIATIDALKPQAKVNLRVMRGDRELDAVAVLANRDAFVFHQAGYADERDRGERSDLQRNEDPFGNVPPYAMQLEHDRRMAEQHERIETELRKLQEEVRLLREAIQRK